MKIVNLLSNGVVIAASDDLALTDSYMVCEGIKYDFYNLTNCSINDVSALPDYFVAGAWIYKNQSWEIYNQQIIDMLKAKDETIQKLKNKATASQLLTATDWTSVASVADPAVSNPYLTNQAEFLSYRSAVRAIAVNPPVTVETWPTQPTEQWSS